MWASENQLKACVVSSVVACDVFVEATLSCEDDNVFCVARSAVSEESVLVIRCLTPSMIPISSIIHAIVAKIEISGFVFFIYKIPFL